MQLPNPAGRGGRKAGSWAGGWRQETGDAGEERRMKERNAGALVCWCVGSREVVLEIKVKNRVKGW